ncbi:hypothetical protein ACP4OV_028061 [Aristida adscensionis]
MARIVDVLEAKAKFDAAMLDVQWAYALRVWDDDPGRLGPAAHRLREVLEEAEKRCIRLLLEEEADAAAMVQEESPSIRYWLKRVKEVADHFRAGVREKLLRDEDEDDDNSGCSKLIARMRLPSLDPKTTKASIFGVITDQLEALMEEYEKLGYTNTGLPIVPCTELPSCGGQHSAIITDVPIVRERDGDKQRIISIITHAAENRKTETDEPVILPIFGPAGVGKTTLVKSIFYDPELFQDYTKAWVDTVEGEDLKKIYTSIMSSSQSLGAELPPLPNDDYSLVDTMRNQLAELFRSGNKKLLLVLDDLWVKAEPLSTQGALATTLDCQDGNPQEFAVWHWQESSCHSDHTQQTHCRLHVHQRFG